MSKKTARKRPRLIKARTRRGVTAIIPYSQIVKPDVYRGKFSLIPTPLMEPQIKAIIAPTPRDVVRKRMGPKGMTFDYVPGWWIKKKLNFVFGFAHSFEVINHALQGESIVVQGRFSVRNPKTGQEILRKEDFGSAKVKFLKGTKTPVDLGNDYKAAATDCLKRCAFQLGFCMDVYGKMEAEESGDRVVEDVKVDISEATNEAGVGLWTDEVTQIQKTLTSMGHTGAKQLQAVKRFAEKEGFKFDGWRMTRLQARNLLTALLQKKLQK